MQNHGNDKATRSQSPRRARGHPATFALVTVLTISPVPLFAQSASERTNPAPGFGGPSSPRVFLDEIERRREDTGPSYVLDALDKAMEPWFEFKDRLDKRTNLQFGGHYQYNIQKADSVLNEPDFGSGGLFRLTGTWTPGGRDNVDAGWLAFTIDHRHKLGNGVAPSALGAQFGYAGTTNAILGDTDWDLVSLFWAQPFNNDTIGFAIGRMDPNESFNTHGFSSPWTGFMNNEVVNAVGVLQPQTSWGIVGGAYFTDNLYGVIGTFDANGTASDNLEFFDGGDELWSGLEFGYVASQEERLQKKINLTLWHVDEREAAGTEESYGAAATASWTFGDFNPFVRVAVSEGDAPVYNKSLLFGFRSKVRNGADIVGIAHSRGDSSAGLGWQNATEAFYNYFFARNLAMTFDIQRIGNPLLNPEDDEVWLFGIRTRFTF